ncbi:MAG: CCA tRNA nucleotidyltransferase [Alphaproteobacteria bacterium]|nr:CCA tRNA nucleotidyltransferase [Alphaproteobacteria bacterium]
MTAPETRRVIAAIEAGGARALFVGGCMRDAVLGRAVKDVDIATPEPPSRVVALLEAAGIRAVPTGLDHGTVTAVAEGAHFEITTLRHDVETYGRHARVAFTDDWAADAERRDFTMNALYGDAEGRVYDPTGGLADLAEGRVRFVGSAVARIKEDVLRLLRFFRFHAHYGRVPPDGETLAACRALAPLIASLSVERVWAELARLMTAPEPAATLDLMAADLVLAHVLPEAGPRTALRRLVRLEAALGLVPDPLRRLAALLDVDARGAGAFAARLRLSRAERKRLVAIAGRHGSLAPTIDPRALRRLVYEDGNDAVDDALAVAWARADGLDEAWRPVWDAARWRRPELPIKGRDARALGVPRGPAVGALVAAVEAWWIENDFAPDRAACLAFLRAKIAASD